MSVWDRLDEIQARADKATEGPWEADHSEENNSAVKPVGADWIDGVAFAGLEADAEFIAHARTDVPRLVAAIQAVLDTCAEIRANNTGTDFRAGGITAASIIESAIENALKESR